MVDKVSENHKCSLRIISAPTIRAFLAIRNLARDATVSIFHLQQPYRGIEANRATSVEAMESNNLAGLLKPWYLLQGL